MILSWATIVLVAALLALAFQVFRRTVATPIQLKPKKLWKA